MSPEDSWLPQNRFWAYRDPEGRDGGPRVLWRKELRTLQQQVLSFSDHS